MKTTHSMNDGRADLMAAVIEHLACYIQSGRPRSAHLATLLLDRLAGDAAADPRLRERCRQLSEVLEHRGEALPGPATGPATIAAAPRRQPWLTWECQGEAA